MLPQFNPSSAHARSEERMSQPQIPGLGSPQYNEMGHYTQSSSNNTSKDPSVSGNDENSNDYNDNTNNNDENNNGIDTMSGTRESHRDPLAETRSAIRKKSSLAGTPVRRRISRACDQCNQLRTKCDGQNPCAHCIGDFPLSFGGRVAGFVLMVFGRIRIKLRVCSSAQEAWESVEKRSRCCRRGNYNESIVESPFNWRERSRRERTDASG